MNIQFIKYRKVTYALSIILVILSIVSLFKYGLNLGIDFTGGSSIVVEYISEKPTIESVREGLGEGYRVFELGDTNIMVKAQEMDRNTTLEVLRGLGEIEEEGISFQSIGPLIGEELKQKTRLVAILSLFAILIYVAISFHRVKNSFLYGINGILALLHDVLITLGILALLSVEIDIPIITALLTVFGYSINDTVVVYDRVRFNLVKNRGGEYEDDLNKSLNETLRRSLNTSITTLIVLFAIFFFGGDTLKFFSLALILGIALGTYSSIFLATPLLYTFKKK